MAKDKSETKHIGGGLDGDHYETKIVDKDGSVFKGAGRTSEESQKIASDKKENDKPSWKPGWL